MRFAFCKSADGDRRRAIVRPRTLFRQIKDSNDDRSHARPFWSAAASSPSARRAKARSRKASRPSRCWRRPRAWRSPIAARRQNSAARIDTVSVVRFTADSPGDQGRLPKRMFRNPPLSLAQASGCHAAPHALHRDGRKHAAMAGQPHRRRDRATANAKWRCSPARNISPPCWAR